MIVSRLGRLGGLHIHLNRSHLYGTSRSRRPPPKPIYLRLITPPSEVAEKAIFDSAALLKQYVGDRQGVLCTLDSEGNVHHISPDKYKDISPTDTYSIATPDSTPLKALQNYVRNCSKVFEQKSRQAMIEFMKVHGMAIKELNRELMDGSKILAEWEGVFESDGRVYFLECKHKMTDDVLAAQLGRMRRSMKILKKPECVGKVFLAGEYWQGGEELMTRARHEYDCGVLRDSGKDMEVLP